MKNNLETIGFVAALMLFISLQIQAQGDSLLLSGNLHKVEFGDLVELAESQTGCHFYYQEQ